MNTSNWIQYVQKPKKAFFVCQKLVGILQRYCMYIHKRFNPQFVSPLCIINDTSDCQFMLLKWICEGEVKVEEEEWNEKCILNFFLRTLCV